MSRKIKKNSNSLKKKSQQQQISLDDEVETEEVFNLNIPFDESDEEHDDSEVLLFYVNIL